MNENFKKTIGWATIFAGILLILGYFFGNTVSSTYLIIGVGGVSSGTLLVTNFFDKKEN